MNQRRQAARASPQALPLMTNGDERRAVLRGGAAKAALGDVNAPALVHQRLGPRFFKGGRLAQLYAQRAGGADRQAEPRAVTQRLVYDLGLAVHHHDGPLGARRHTHPAAVAQFLINPNDLT